MAKIHAYLNFDGNCKEAFDFYQKVFKTESIGTYTYDGMPSDPNSPPLPEEAKGKIMHTAIQINDQTMIMGADVIQAFGHKLSPGNATYIMLDTDTIEEAQELYEALSVNAKVMEMELADTFFAERFSSFQDQFGIYWMIHFEGNRKMD